MKKQLLLVALFSAGVAGNVNARTMPSLAVQHKFEMMEKNAANSLDAVKRFLCDTKKQIGSLYFGLSLVAKSASRKGTAEAKNKLMKPLTKILHNSLIAGALNEIGLEAEDVIDIIDMEIDENFDKVFADIQNPC